MAKKKTVIEVKPEIKPEIKKGVKAGTKRGAYKKNKITPLDLENNQKAVNEIKKDLQIDDNNNIDNNSVFTEKTETETLPLETPEINDDIHTLKYEQFLKDSNDFNPDDFKEVETPIIEVKKEDAQNDGKEFDFTGSNNTENKNNPLNDLKDSQKVLINGMLLLSICDFVIPNVIKLISKYMDSDATKVDVSKTKLDSEQKASLKEVADFASGYIFEKINPMLLFFIGMGSMYYGNFNSELNKVKERKKIQPIKKEVIKKPIKRVVKKKAPIKKTVIKKGKK